MTQTVTVILTTISLLYSYSLAAAGELALKIGDIEGETVSFDLDPAQSDWSGNSGWEGVSITARPSDPEAWERYKSFALGFSMMNGSVDNPDARLLTVAENELTTLFAEEDTGLDLTITQFETQGDMLAISGTIEMVMGTSENYGRDIDLSSPVTVSGDFEVILPRLE